MRNHWTYVKEKIKEKFKVVDSINSLDFDYEISNFEIFCKKYQNYTFLQNEILIIEIIDTQYYLPHSPIGLTIQNCFKIIYDCGIPSNFLLFLSPHYGLRNEIKKISDYYKLQTPMVIETFLNNVCFPETTNFSIGDVNCTAIEYPFLFINNTKRSHRLFALCLLEHQSLIDKGIVTWNFE